MFLLCKAVCVGNDVPNYVWCVQPALLEAKKDSTLIFSELLCANNIFSRAQHLVLSTGSDVRPGVRVSPPLCRCDFSWQVQLLVLSKGSDVRPGTTTTTTNHQTPTTNQPPTTSHQPASNHRQPPPTTHHPTTHPPNQPTNQPTNQQPASQPASQPPTTSHNQAPPTTNQPPTPTNHHQPPTTNCPPQCLVKLLTCGVVRSYNCLVLFLQEPNQTSEEVKQGSERAALAEQ